MQNIQSWIRRITDNEMPIFGRTVQEVISVSEDDDASAAQLGQVVLKDAAMTSRVLKLANSSYYNPGRQRFSTISRAIMMLGFDTVRSMCLTVALIDSLVQGAHREHLVREMARSLHAATQAQKIARQRKDPNPEELFISALLFHIGDLAFWCFAGKEGDKLDALLKQGKEPVAAQKEVLGFSLKSLSEGLAKEWALSDLLQESLDKPQSKDRRTRNIVLAHQLAEAAEQGWENDQVLRLTGELAALAGIPAEAMSRQLHETAKQTVETSTCYGAQAVAQVIPLPAAYRKDTVDHEDEAKADAYPSPNPGLQLQILRELTGLMTTQAGFNTVVEMVMEGLHRGVGLDRVLFALLSPDRKELRPKYVVGDPEDHLRQAFGLSMGSSAAAPVRYVLIQHTPLWAHPKSPPEVREHVSDAFCWATGSDNLFMAPVIIRDKPVGVFYADCAASGRPLDSDGYEAFRHFVQQANLVLNHLAARR